jgi:NAD(P)H dehydrogenase (quinone)
MYKMAQAAVEGAEEVDGADVKLLRVPEILSEDVLKQMGSLDFQKQIADIPEVTHEDLTDSDALIFGIPTRFGNMIGQWRMFLDSTGPLWSSGALVGKVGSVMSSSATQHGGQESTVLTSLVTLLHLGLIYVGLPYTFQGQMTLDEISGGSPYGASTIAGGDGSRMPSENELDAARFQGRHVTQIAKKLAT